MALEIKKRERENTQALLYRFKKGVQQSGILLQAKKARFKGRDKGREAKKRAALRREELKKEYAKLRKLQKPEK